MAIKENLEYVKGELNSQEQFLENAIKGELFFKKHKLKIISIFVVGALALSVYGGITYVKNQNIKKANQYYSSLQKNSKNVEAKNDLIKLDPSLFALFAFSNFEKSGSKEFLNEALKLEIDPTLKDILLFANNPKNDDFMPEYANLLNGFKLLKAGKIKEARNEFFKIPQDSPLQEIVRSLNHFQAIK